MDRDEGGANHSRLTSITYASGYVLTFNYASGLNSDISRLTSLSDSGGTLESFDYLGLGTVVTRAHSQPGVDLTYLKRSGESNADAGDQYIGLDRFGASPTTAGCSAATAPRDRRDAPRPERFAPVRPRVVTFGGAGRERGVTHGYANGVRTPAPGAPAPPRTEPTSCPRPNRTRAPGRTN